MFYRYRNLNPLSAHEQDCVCRAIANASGIAYEKIASKLYFTAKLLDCEMLCVCCYDFLIENVLGYERVYGYKGTKISEFHRQKGTFLIRVSGHLTLCRNGTIEDIWDCRNELIDMVWQVD